MTVRLDKEVIEEKLEKFYQFEIYGQEADFDLDDYSVLFQAGTFEKGHLAERFCNAIYVHGPIRGGREV